MDHTEESHVRLINEICRTCGRLALTRKEKKGILKKNSCSDFQTEINSIFGIDISSDSLISTLFISVANVYLK